MSKGRDKTSKAVQKKRRQGLTRKQRKAATVKLLWRYPWRSFCGPSRMTSAPTPGEIYARQLLNRATLACRFDPALRCNDPECEDCRRGA